MSNYWSPEAIAARTAAASQQYQVTPNEQIPGSIPPAQLNTGQVGTNTGQEGSGTAGAQYYSNFGYNPSSVGYNPGVWNQGREYWDSVSANPINIAMLNEDQKAKIEIEKSQDEIDSDVQLDAAGNKITGNEFKFDRETGKPLLAETQEEELSTGGGEGLLGKYISEKNPELYGKMTDNAGLFQGGVEGRSFGRLKDFFEGKTPGLFGNPKNEDIGSLKLSKEDNRHDGGSTGGSTGGQTKDDEGGLSDEQKIAMGQAFSQMAQGHRGSFGKYGDIF